MALDPGFALAHGVRALLGHEFGASVDVAEAVRQAQRSATRRRCSERERSFLHAVSCRTGGSDEAGSQAFLQHLESYPRDALALSTAVPTIAFAGVTDIPEDGWALVESLAPAYGDDWWYAGLLAFTRTDQERWSEAANLAERALQSEPSSGHAVHALAHVHYETDDHAEGLRWLDGWIARSGGETHHRAHFSWHAALHELALGDDAALLRRYDEQLAPPLVTGMRALVDAGSLLWRADLEDVWEDTRSIAPVLDHAGPELLTSPPTPFTAMHAALALAAARDEAGLAALRSFTSRHARAVFGEVVTPLVDGLSAFAEGRYDAAATILGSVHPTLWRVGGSAAQREVIQDTWLHALLGAGRVDEARVLLERRLDRRPSRRDLCRLGQLQQPEDRSEIPVEKARRDPI